MKWSRVAWLGAVAFVFPAASQNPLNQFSDSIQALAARVAPSVVQVSVTRFSSEPDTSDGRTGAVFGRQQSIGSGIIIDPAGYIVTNAHVVQDAQRIRVTLVGQRDNPGAKGKPDQVISSALAQQFAPAMDAMLVGVYKELDLALIKIAATGLPALTFADYTKLRQGQIVFAFGCRQGLSNSVSMGVVSSVARQPDPDSPFVYIQTDASINPGDSGGPLVNTAGEVVGLDTFIYSQSGGSEGIGFAIPSPLIEFVSGQLRKFGHVHRQQIGIGVQTLTPSLAGALNLPRGAGVIVSDVAPDGPAEAAGVKLNDILISVDGRAVDNLPLFMRAMLTHPSGKPVKLEVLRGTDTISVDVDSEVESHESDGIAGLINPEKNRISRLGFIGVTIDKSNQSMFPKLRGEYGVVVAAKAPGAMTIPTSLEVGDVIHELNGAIVESVEGLRGALEKLKRGADVALFVERDGKLLYVSFEME